MENDEYQKYIEDVRKWYVLRMRMIKRCVAHKAQAAAQRYRESVPTSQGLIINNKLEEI